MSPLVPALLVVAALVVHTWPARAAARVRAVAPADPVTTGAPPRANAALPRLPGAPRPGLAARADLASVPPAVLAALALAAVSLGPVAAVLLAGGLHAARLATRRAAASRAARANAAALPDVCRTLAAELRAGAPPPAALARAADGAPPAVGDHLRRLAAAGHLGTGPPAAEPPGAERLRAVVSLWSVAADAGAGLADGLDRLGAALAAEERQRADVAAQLAGPRASAAVLACLPAFGLALAAVLGADPAAFLTTPPGLACFGAAALLDATGVWWVRRLTRTAYA